MKIGVKWIQTNTFTLWKSACMHSKKDRWEKILVYKWNDYNDVVIKFFYYKMNADTYEHNMCTFLMKCIILLLYHVFNISECLLFAPFKLYAEKDEIVKESLYVGKHDIHMQCIETKNIELKNLVPSRPPQRPSWECHAQKSYQFLSPCLL